MDRLIVNVYSLFKYISDSFITNRLETLDDFSDENDMITKQNLYQMENNLQICEIIDYSESSISVFPFNPRRVFVRDYTSVEMEIIRRHFMIRSHKYSPKIFSWGGDMNTSTFKLCLSYLNMVKYIHLKTSVSHHDIKQLCGTLKNNNSVIILNISYPIDSISAEILGTFLATNKNIRSFGIKDFSTDLDVINILCSFLKSNTTITHITLNLSNIFREKDYEIFILIVKSPLTSLDISGNLIDISGIKILMDILKHNTSLNDLNLSRSNICDYGMATITEMLKTNKTLTTINLSFNMLTNKSIKYISEFLDNNNTLTHMYLNCNKFTADGFNKLSFKNNFSILALFRYILYNNNTFEKEYMEFKPTDMPKLFNWYLRNMRISNFKDTLIVFRKLAEPQIPDELINIIYTYF